MAIIQKQSGGNLMPLSVLAHRQDFDVISESVPFEDISFQGCPDILKVFGEQKTPNPIDHKNDFTSFLFKTTPFTTIVLKLLDKDCNEIETLDNNLLGVYYPVGTWSVADGFSAQQSLYTGFKLEWDKVLQIIGAGYYSIKIQRYIGELLFSELCSCNYFLQEYSDNLADKTIRLSTIQNGDILDSFDYTGMNWEQQWRTSGFFGYAQDKLETDNYLDSNRNLTQIQDQLYKEYTLQTDFIPRCFKGMFDDILLSNEIYIDDYNLNNSHLYRKLEVIPSDSQTEYFIESQKFYKEITFEDRKRKKVKRNVK